jgi:uncharacterized membrane-anchored protein
MREQALLQAAQAEGLLPANAGERLDAPGASWVVTAVSLIGAQFAVLPFLVVLAFVGERLFLEPPGSFVMSALLLGLAVAGLRRPHGHFVQHLSFTVLLVGLGLLSFSFANVNDFGLEHLNMTLGLMAAVCVGVALATRVVWVQHLLGLLFGLLCVMVSFSPQGTSDFVRCMYPATHSATVLALCWCAWCLLEPRWSAQLPKVARKIAPLADGVGLSLLLFALLTSGSVLMGPGVFDGNTRQGSADVATAGTAQLFALGQQTVLQLGIALVSGAFLVWRWSLLQPARRRELALVMAVFAGLLLFAFFTDDGGVVVLVGTVALMTGRRRLLALAVLVLLAQLSGFYYALGWPLIQKAAVLAVAGAALAVFLVVVRFATRQAQDSAGVAAKTPRSRWATGLIAVAAVVSLGVINYDVSQKEQVIAEGQKIYIAISPRDPRSLMQGDYMALNFDLPANVRATLDSSEDLRERMQGMGRVLVVARLDERGVATLLRLAAGPDELLASGELLVPLKQVNGSWVVVTDAFFFPEGQGGNLRDARFGEFRVLPDGRALLVGLVSAQLQPIKLDKGLMEQTSEGLDAMEAEQAVEAVEAEEEGAQAATVEIVAPVPGQSLPLGQPGDPRPVSPKAP